MLPLSTLPLFSCENILPYVRSIAEARCLLSLNIIGIQLEASMKSLLLCLQHDKYLLELMNTLKTSNICNENTSLLSLLYNASILVRKRVLEQLNVVKILLERLKTLGSSVRQYGEQHRAMVSELASTRTTALLDDLVDQKKKLAKAELGLYDRVQSILTLATQKLTSEVYDKVSKYNDVVSIQSSTVKKPKVAEPVIVPSASEMHPYQNSPLLNNNTSSKLNISLVSEVPYDNDLLISPDLIDGENGDNDKDFKRQRYDNDYDNRNDNDNRDSKRQKNDNDDDNDDDNNNNSTPSYDDKSRDILLPLDNVQNSSQNNNNTNVTTNTQLSSIENISNENIDLNSSIRSNTSVEPNSQISDEAKGSQLTSDDHMNITSDDHINNPVL